MPTLCGRPTKRGTPCARTLNPNGLCPVHNCDLSARNAAVAAAFRARDPEAFKQQRSAAGRKGYLATGARQGWERANEYARQHRLKHPSAPEQWALDVLADAGLNHYTREYPLDGGQSIDLAWPDARLAVEVNGHQHKPSFGEESPRAAKQARKVAALEAEGWRVLVIDATGDRDAAAQQLIQFARQVGVAPAIDPRHGGNPPSQEPSL